MGQKEFKLTIEIGLTNDSLLPLYERKARETALLNDSLLGHRITGGVLFVRSISSKNSLVSIRYYERHCS